MAARAPPTGPAAAAALELAEAAARDEELAARELAEVEVGSSSSSLAVLEGVAAEPVGDLVLLWEADEV